MPDKFARFPSTVDGPAKSLFTVTPNNAADLPTSTRALYVGGAGNIQLELVGDPDGTLAVLTGVPVGTTLNLRVRKIWATNTTATNLVGLY